VLSGGHVNPASTGVGSSHIGSINIATCLFPDGRAGDITLATGCSSAAPLQFVRVEPRAGMPVPSLFRPAMLSLRVLQATFR